MYFRFFLFTVLILSFVQGCKKDDISIIKTPKSTSDFGVYYSLYQNGIFYVSDTFRTKFTITNYGPSAFETGDTLYAAVEMNNVVYGLDLIGSGPTAIILKQALPINGTYDYNPGYLLRTPTLNYFGFDTLDVKILLYGQSGSPIDKTFPKDPTPKNNTAILRLTTNNHYVLP